MVSVVECVIVDVAGAELLWLVVLVVVVVVDDDGLQATNVAMAQNASGKNT